MKGLVLSAVALIALCLAAPAQATHVSCGQTITADTVLDSDLSCTTGSALIVDADDVTVDLNDHQIEANGSGDWGVNNTLGSDRTTVRNGTVRGFETAGVRISGDDGVVEGITFVDNNNGLNFASSRRARAEGNRFELNNTGVSIHNDDQSEGENVVRQNVFDGGDALGSTGLAIFATTGNRIEDNVLSAIEQGVNMTTVVGTRIEGNHIEISAEGGAQWGLILFGDEVVSDNEILGNTISGGSLGIWHSLTGSGSRIAGNTIVRSDIGILWEVTSPDMRIEDNVISEPEFFGIQLDWIGGRPVPQHRTTIARNRVTDSGLDGINVEENPGEVLLEQNLVSGSADDGIVTGPDPFGEVPTRPALIAGNSSWENGDWGIEAASPASDGGGNRAWSNGRPAQCLNVVCGPAPPAGVALSPQTATNPVGDRHCVTATVSDPGGDAAPGVRVRFAVDSGDEGSAESDANGEAEFCYDGPLTPRTDSISAYADDDRDSVQDPGEPGDSASKEWVVPESSARCKVSGAGTIAASSGDRASFRVSAHAHKARTRGSVVFRDRGEPLVLQSTEVESVTCSGSDATLFGRTRGSSPLYFRVDVVDQGRDGDRFRIRTSDGYDSGDQSVTRGGIRIH